MMFDLKKQLVSHKTAGKLGDGVCRLQSHFPSSYKSLVRLLIAKPMRSHITQLSGTASMVEKGIV